MTIIGTFPDTIANGQVEDATVVMSLFSWIQAQTNGNACPATVGTLMLKADGFGGTLGATDGTDFLSPTTGATNAIYTQAGTGSVATTVQTQLRSFPVNIDNYGAAGTGLVDDSAALTKALAASDAVYGTPGKTYLIGSQVTVGSNKRLFGNGATLQSAVGITMLLFSGNGSVLRDWVVNANGGLYAVRNTGLRNTFCENRFIGSVGHYIFSPVGSSHTAIQNNVVDGQGVSLITTCFVFEDSVHINVTGNRFVDIQNWCVQVRGASSRVTISDNNCFATQYTSTVIATAGQTVFNFILSNACHLAGIQVNGVPFDTGLTFLPTVPAATPTTTWQVTFASGRTVGDSVKLIAHRAAENIQINGSTSDFTIRGNTISGGGDSGIVVTSSAQRGAIVGNIIRDIAYTGISLEGGIQQVSVVGNVVGNTSLITTAATYSSCILIGGPDNLVEGNTLYNVFGAPTAYCGISINYYASEDGSFDESIKIGVNNYAGVFTKKLFIPNQSGTQKRQSISLMDGMTTYYPERINLESAYTNTPANTAFWSYSGFGGTFSIRDTTIKQGGSASLKTVAGEYIDMQPLAAAALMDCVVNLSFWAIANSGSSYVTAFLDVGGSVIGSPTITVSSTSWQQYNINFPFSSNEIASSLKFRVGANTGFANFQHFELSITKL